MNEGHHAVFADGAHVLLRAIAFVTFESVGQMRFGKLFHVPVARYFRDDGSKGDCGNIFVAADKRFLPPFLRDTQSCVEEHVHTLVPDERSDVADAERSSRSRSGTAEHGDKAVIRDPDLRRVDAEPLELRRDR